MRKQTCFTCGAVFEAAFPIFKCNVCQQTDAIKKAMEKQKPAVQQQNTQPIYAPRSAPTYTWFTEEDRNQKYEVILGDPVKIEESRKLKQQEKIYTFLFYASPFYILPLLWFTVSGWFMLFLFLIFSFAWIGIGKYLHKWTMSNAYSIHNVVGDKYVPIP